MTRISACAVGSRSSRVRFPALASTFPSRTIAAPTGTSPRAAAERASSSARLIGSERSKLLVFIEFAAVLLATRRALCYQPGMSDKTKNGGGGSKGRPPASRGARPPSRSAGPGSRGPGSAPRGDKPFRKPEVERKGPPRAASGDKPFRSRDGEGSGPARSGAGDKPFRPAGDKPFRAREG